MALLRRWLPIWTKPPRLTVSKWADKRRYLSRESSSQPGKYRSSLAPYQREPMDAANDPQVQSTALMWASQVGKTEVINNVCGYFMDADPSPQLMAQPTLEMAETWSKTRLTPMLRDCPCFHGKVKDSRTRDSGNTILNKLYLGGDIAIAGANSPSSLSARPRRVVLMDEIDRYPSSAGAEGDPCLIIEKRTESFWNSVIYKSSSPTTKGLSRIEKEFEQTDKRYWFCPCPKCGEFQTLKWRQVLYGKLRIDHLVAHGAMTAAEAQSKFAVFPLDGSDAVYACEKCHCHLTDADRVKMIRAGEWRATAPFHGKRGYHLNGIYSPFRAKKGFKNRLHQMAAQFIEARAGGRQTLRVWTNTFLAETFEEEVERMETAPLLKRLEKYTPQTLPNEIVVALATIDVQKRWLQVQITGLGLEEETWGIESRTIEGDTEQGDVWQDLADLISKTRFRRQDGVELPVTATAIDMRHKPKKVVDFVKKFGLPRVYPIYGVAGGQTLLVTTRYSKHYQLRTYAVDTKMGKDTIYARLAMEEPGPRFMHFPAGHGYNEEFFAQLTAEVLKTKYQHGYPKQFYEKIRERNEALDLSVYFLAAVDILKPNLTAISKRLKPAPEAQQPNPPIDYPIKPVNAPPSQSQAPQRTKRMSIRIGQWR